MSYTTVAPVEWPAMNTQPTGIESQRATAELNAAAEHIRPYIERLDGLMWHMERNGGHIPSDLPPQFRILVSELFNAHASGERTFFRHVDMYPECREEWIKATQTQFAMTYTRGLHDVLCEKFALLKKCAAIAGAGADIQLRDEKPIASVHYGDNYLGDIYSKNQGAAFGPNAHAENNKFMQLQVDKELQGVNLPELAASLARLRTELRKEAMEPEDDVVLGQIAAAQSAAKVGDGEKVTSHLKQAGTWALDVATKIGEGLAIAALKSAMGLSGSGD